MKNTISWFEIPVVDLPRAAEFYGQLFGTTLKTDQSTRNPMAILESEGVTGALVKTADRKPSGDGALLYLNADGQLDTMLGRVAKAGGSVVVARTEIGAHGSFAILEDTEGNRVGLHQER